MVIISTKFWHSGPEDYSSGPECRIYLSTPCIPRPEVLRPEVPRCAEPGEYLEGLRFRLAGGAFEAVLECLRAALKQGGEAFLIQHPQTQGLGLIQL